MNGAAGTQIQHGDGGIWAPILVVGAQPWAGQRGVRYTASAGGPRCKFELAGHRIPRRLSQGRGKLGSHADATKRGYMLTKDLALMLGLPFRP